MILANDATNLQKAMVQIQPKWCYCSLQRKIKQILDPDLNHLTTYKVSMLNSGPLLWNIFLSLNDSTGVPFNERLPSDWCR